MEEKKRCPYCGEEILAVAKKCKHCGEWLESKEPSKKQQNCPICGELVDEDLDTCPYCHEPTHFNETQIDTKIMEQTDNCVKPERVDLPSTPPVEITPSRKNFMRTIGNYVLYFLGGCIIFGCIYGIKQCAKPKKQDFFQNTNNPLAEKFKKDREEAFAKLTKSPWYGKNTYSVTDVDEGWITKADMVVDSKKTYTTDNNYTEEGTMTLEITCSHSDLMWKAEGEIKFREKGDIGAFSNTDFYESTKDFYGEIIDARVKFNNTTTDDEDIAMTIRLKLNEIIKEAQKSEESTHYKIKTLTAKNLELDEMDKKEIFKSTGLKLSYKRD